MEQEEKVVSFFRFEDLRVYGKATDYASWLSRQFANAHSESERVLIETICHSAYDVALNIAEGSSRNKSQFDHYLKIAKTAVRECVAYTEVAWKLGLFTDEQHNMSREYLMELTRMLGALIISLQRSSERRASKAEEETEADSFSDDEMSF